jgi:hypothetical protein
MQEILHSKLEGEIGFKKSTENTKDEETETTVKHNEEVIKQIACFHYNRKEEIL